MYRHVDTSSTTQMAKKPGQTLKTLWYILNEIYMDTH